MGGCDTRPGGSQHNRRGSASSGGVRAKHGRGNTTRRAFASNQTPQSLLVSFDQKSCQMLSDQRDRYGGLAERHFNKHLSELPSAQTPPPAFDKRRLGIPFNPGAFHVQEHHAERLVGFTRGAADR